MNIVEWLKGKKTYLSAAAIAALSFCLLVGWISRETFEALVGLLGGAGLASMRRALDN